MRSKDQIRIFLSFLDNFYPVTIWVFYKKIFIRIWPKTPYFCHFVAFSHQIFPKRDNIWVGNCNMAIACT